MGSPPRCRSEEQRLRISKNWLHRLRLGTKEYMIAVIGNLVVALLAISLFTATLRLSK